MGFRKFRIATYGNKSQYLSRMGYDGISGEGVEASLDGANERNDVRTPPLGVEMETNLNI